MRTPQPTITCPQCSQANSPVAVTCATCGANLAVSGTLGDPQANTVAGAPVPASPGEIGAGLSVARGRLMNMAPELATIMAEAVSRRAANHKRALDLADRIRILAQPPRPQAVVVAPPRQGPPIPARAAWFIFAGWWLTFYWVVATWVLLCLVVFGRQANRMITMIPNVLTLRTSNYPPRSIVPLQPSYMAPVYTPMRIAYTVLVGWWVCLAWMLVAYAVSLTVIGIPVGYRMFSVAPAIAHL